ncbi:hypothetical protein BDB00DRAFT_928434 [Zychaea mexicana]|uniref:uncharacterized protein n=1 Tax=Zychaea mexicana TaxID=64656 RepID=UPI0022FDB6EA|nr:uncharacterized protein BDB00DRAFT_928434 [Zychaea mexicana]KAI9494149.1 hypothetical protein BDB00DRAFT_928434 [Zychaea mexicana]
MDFASAPLQALFSQNADLDQLTTFLTQLERRYRETAEDEKDRFGALQILLPALKAHLLRVSSDAEREKVLGTYLQPLLMISFRHDSMIATESVSLLSDAVAYWMARSILRDNKEDTFDDEEQEQEDGFGRFNLVLLLGQLLTVMEAEPDFVDLHPIRFIRACLSSGGSSDGDHLNDSQNEEWKLLQSKVALKRRSDIRMVTASVLDEDMDDSSSMISSTTFNTTTSLGSSKSATTLDLECCIDVINRYVLELAGDKEELKKDEAYGWMDVIMAIAVAMLPCTDAPIRAKLTNELIPNVYRWQQQQSYESVPLEKRKHWAEMLWKRTRQIFELPATNLLRSETYGLIARFFELYFVVDQDEPVVYLDLRYDEDFFKILQSGLRSNESLYRKYSSYILKRIIDYTSKYPEIKSSTKPWTKYFEWSTEKSDVYITQWADWFLLYEIMHETVIHLVEPVLPKLEVLLLNAETNMDASWWILLFYRGFQNDMGSVKKGILEYVFGLQNPKSLSLLAGQSDFIFGTLLKSIDVIGMYSVPTQGTLVSPFGEKLKDFMHRLVQSIESNEQKAQFLSQLLHHIAHVVNGYVPILYIMEGIVDIDPIPAWGSDELRTLRYLVDRHRNFHLVKTRLYLRKLGIQAVIKFANPEALSFSDVAKTVSSLITDNAIKAKGEVYKSLRTWLEQNVSKDKTLDSLLASLKERVEAYISTTASNEEDIPMSLLRNQANVLARMSVFLITNNDGEPQKKQASQLFEALTKKLNDNLSSVTFLNRLLILVDSLWNVYDTTFEGCDGFADLIGIDNIQQIVKQIDDQWINLEKENVTEELLVDLFVSMSKHILVSSTCFDNAASREQLLKEHHGRCMELLRARRSPTDANQEMAREGHLRLLAVVYEAARRHSYLELSYDQPTADLLCQVQTKKTHEALQQVRNWGDTISAFIRCKWKCVQQLMLYTSMVLKETDSAASRNNMFDPESLFEAAVEELECASELCAAAVINSVGTILSLRWKKSVEMMHTAVEYTIALIEENFTQSKTSPPMMRALVDMIFQPEVLLDETLMMTDDGPVKKVLNYILEIGELKPYVVTQCATLLHTFWTTKDQNGATKVAADKSMLYYAPEIVRFLVYGPLRDREDQKLEAATAVKLQDPQTIRESEDSVAMNFTQNDYMARVYMNDLILRLNKDNDLHVQLAERLMDLILDKLTDSSLVNNHFPHTIEHRTKIRLWCSMLLLHRYICEEKAEHYVTHIWSTIRGETSVSVRCYSEWLLARLFRQFPSQLNTLYSAMQVPDVAPHYVVSYLTITFSLGDILDDTSARDYFEEIFSRIMPWLTSNNFTVRLYAYSAWFRNLNACRARGLNPDLEKNRYMASLVTFMEQYVDTINFAEKIKSNFYMTEFNPLEDYNLEFIFRQMMSVFDVLENEKIASRAFMKVNPEYVESCPFENPHRRNIVKFSDSINIEEEEEKDKSDEKKEQAVNEDVSYQKKIMPWEMMLETDVELTKDLVKSKRRRNDLIVVASLVDRVPNIAGLCRTCEIFNASLLVVNNIKMKEDFGFTNISVASERWMPMLEVGEDDVASYLETKKQEGYVLCGLEQTTTSATLGEFEFPERCVLLLGKERQGVPANLLQMLDQTIEIPQQGITRSLNVHVSGAICIYEYAKQMQWRQHGLQTNATVAASAAAAPLQSSSPSV